MSYSLMWYIICYPLLHEANCMMATLNEVDDTAVDDPEELSTQEEAVWEQTPERRLVEVLLDISEEDFMKELEPHEYHCYSGWEDAVSEYISYYSKPCLNLMKGSRLYNNTCSFSSITVWSQW